MFALESLTRKDPLFARYGVTTQAVTVRQKTLQIAQLDNHAQWLTDLAPASEAGSLKIPFWFTIWPASLLLVDFIAAIPPDPGRRWLEIGAGLGICGLFAAAFGHQVMVTDKEPPAVALIKASARLNHLTDRMDIKVMDWTIPQTEETYDVILASEKVYDPNNIPSLVTFLERHLPPGGTLYLAKGWDIKGLSFFEALKGDNRFIWETRERRLRSDDEVHGANIYTIRKR